MYMGVKTFLFLLLLPMVKRMGEGERERINYKLLCTDLAYIFKHDYTLTQVQCVSNLL